MKLIKNSYRFAKATFFKNEDGEHTGFYNSLKVMAYDIKDVSVGYMKHYKDKKFYI